MRLGPPKIKITKKNRKGPMNAYETIPIENFCIWLVKGPNGLNSKIFLSLYYITNFIPARMKIIGNKPVKGLDHCSTIFN